MSKVIISKVIISIVLESS